MFVTRKRCAWRNNTVIEISLVVEDSSTSRSSANIKSPIILSTRPTVIVQGTEIRLQPWILIPTDYHAWLVDIQEKDVRVGWGILQQEMLD
jgi:hypothetical protein